MTCYATGIAVGRLTVLAQSVDRSIVDYSHVELISPLSTSVLFVSPVHSGIALPITLMFRPRDLVRSPTACWGGGSMGVCRSNCHCQPIISSGFHWCSTLLFVAWCQFCCRLSLSTRSFCEYGRLSLLTLFALGFGSAVAADWT
jgi:hypothetical protein